VCTRIFRMGPLGRREAGIPLHHLARLAPCDGDAQRGIRAQGLLLGEDEVERQLCWIPVFGFNLDQDLT